jgi:hypothetical protein
MLDQDFVADCPYQLEAILFDGILEIDRTPRHVSGALMVHVTGMLGFAHACFVLGLRHADGWIGYGMHIHAARYGALAAIGPPIHLECRATQVRRIRGSVYVRYAFRSEQEGALVYESEPGAVWRRVAEKA